MNLLFMKYLIRILLIHFTYRITNLTSHAISCSCKLFPLEIWCILWIKMKYNFKFANNLTNNRTIHGGNIFIMDTIFRMLLNKVSWMLNKSLQQDTETPKDQYLSLRTYSYARHVVCKIIVSREILIPKT